MKRLPQGIPLNELAEKLGVSFAESGLYPGGGETVNDAEGSFPSL